MSYIIISLNCQAVKGMTYTHTYSGLLCRSKSLTITDCVIASCKMNSMWQNTHKNTGTSEGMTMYMYIQKFASVCVCVCIYGLESLDSSLSPPILLPTQLTMWDIKLGMHHYNVLRLLPTDESQQARNSCRCLGIAKCCQWFFVWMSICLYNGHHDFIFCKASPHAGYYVEVVMPRH